MTTQLTQLPHGPYYSRISHWTLGQPVVPPDLVLVGF